MRPTYRLKQGLRALFAFTATADYALAEQYLSPELLRLFCQMRHSEQLHSLHVLRAVLAQGTTPADLAVAALLHDVGKSRYPLMLWQKTLPVLVPAFLREQWGQGDGRNPLLRPFAVYAQHPAWGADMIASAGATEAAIWLVAHHQDSLDKWQQHDLAHLLKRLQQADDAN